MVIIIYGDNIIDLKSNVEMIKAASPEDEVVGFNDLEKLRHFAHERIINLAFLPISTAEITGFHLASILKSENPNVYTVIMSENPDYALDAFRADVNSYMVVPIERFEFQKKIRLAQYYGTPSS